MRGRQGLSNFKGQRLRQAREARGLTIISLAEILNISRYTFSKYEKDELAPDADLLEQISLRLAMPIEFFFCAPPAPDTAPTFYRSLSAATKNARRKAELRADWLREAVDFLEELVEFPMVNIPTLDLPDHPQSITRGMIESAATSLREHWSIEDGPVGNLVRTAETAGFVVSRFLMESESLDAFSRWPECSARPFVLLNTEKNAAVRMRFDTAHEVGHQILHRHMSPTLIRKPETLKLVEQQAFRFAGAFLMPEESFLDDVDAISLDYLRTLKPTWGVSIGAMLMRLRALELIDDAYNTRLWRLYGARGYRRKEPLDDELDPEEPQLLASAVNTLGGPTKVANVLRKQIVLPNNLQEELFGLPVGSMTIIAGPAMKPEEKSNSVVQFPKRN